MLVAQDGGLKFVFATVRGAVEFLSIRRYILSTTIENLRETLVAAIENSVCRESCSMRYNRRQFTYTALGVCGALAVQDQSLIAQTANLPIIDTHQHLWDLVQFQPPWLGDADARIAAKHDMRDYVSETTGLNLVKAVYMEVDVAQADQVKEAEYVLGLIRDGKSPTVAAVISGRPNSPDFAPYMERYRNNAAIKGVRQVLHVPSAQRGLCLQAQFIKSVQLLGAMGKSFDLCMRPTELADGAELAGRCPDTRFIVDHCGNADPKAWSPANGPTPPTHDVDSWKRDIEKLAARPNVVCKISGIVAGAPRGWKTDDLAPAINFCLDAFGPDRVMFGGDWPVCKLGASFAQWVNSLKEIVSQRPTAAQKKLLHDNAQAFYGLS